MLMVAGGCQNPANMSSGAENQYQIIPKPAKLFPKKGRFRINADTRILVESQDASLWKAADYLSEFIQKGSDLRLPVSAAGKSKNAIIFRPDPEIANEEGYRLKVSKSEIVISASTGAGAFYGVQTLLQLMPPAVFSPVNRARQFTVNCVEIIDEPRFAYRGMHLDVARHIFPVSFIKKYIDLLAMHKQNRFHWHLTDDQGWRIEIMQYPKLQQVAAYRDETVIGHASEKPPRFDGKRYGGYYTQEEVKDIVKYAADRFITIIPEIEMPGHSSAVLAAYPELGCSKGPFRVQTTWGVFKDVLCPKEETFEFLENVLIEVMDLFPSEYIHIGGDECPKAAWKNSEFCRRLMLREELEDENELQSYFISRIEQFLNENGRKIIGWDEILEGGIAPNATIMSWRGTEGGIAAARQGHNAIMTPTSHCYLDYYQSTSEEEPLAIGGYLPLEKVYAFDPVPEELEVYETGHILGVQGNLWTEYIATPEHAEYMAFPRAIALAEVGWTPQNERRFQDFAQRLVYHFNRLNTLKVNYANHILDVEGKTTGTEAGLLLHMKVKAGNYEIQYMTIGGADKKTVYKNPILIDQDTIIIAATHNNGIQIGNVAKFVIRLHKAAGKPIELLSPPHPAYGNGGKEALVNGIPGSNSRYGDNEWLGWSGEDFEATIDLGEIQPVNKVSLRFFNSPTQWIYLPKKIEVYVSDDGIEFKKAGQSSAQTTDDKYAKEIEFPMAEITGRFVKIKAERFGIIPDGKQGADHEAWLFVDEIVVE